MYLDNKTLYPKMKIKTKEEIEKQIKESKKGMIAIISRTFNTAMTIKSEKMMKQMLQSGTNPLQHTTHTVEDDEEFKIRGMYHSFNMKRNNRPDNSKNDSLHMKESQTEHLLSHDIKPKRSQGASSKQTKRFQDKEDSECNDIQYQEKSIDGLQLLDQSMKQMQAITRT